MTTISQIAQRDRANAASFAVFADSADMLCGLVNADAETTRAIQDAALADFRESTTRAVHRLRTIVRVALETAAG